MRPFKDPEFTLPADLPHDLASSFQAERYQDWIMRTIRPWMGKRVLELGSGCGSMSRWMVDSEHLVLTEPDTQLVGLLRTLAPRWSGSPSKVEVQQLALPQDSLARFKGLNLDTITSFNVLEHIEDDQAVLADAAELMRNSQAPGPRRIISYVPAHPFAYGAHDRYTQHFRRYDRARFRMLAAAVAPDAKHSLMSFNFFGLWVWWLKYRVLKQDHVDSGTISLFERVQPILEPFDRLILRGLRVPFGQSLISVLEWPARKP